VTLSPWLKPMSDVFFLSHVRSPLSEELASFTKIDSCPLIVDRTEGKKVIWIGREHIVATGSIFMNIKHSDKVLFAWIENTN
jgi:hypothetical protein